MNARYLIESKTDLVRANDFRRSGLISDREWRRFEIAWLWGSDRFSGYAGAIHDAFSDAHGLAAYYRRINRMRRVCGFPEYPTRPECAS